MSSMTAMAVSEDMHQGTYQENQVRPIRRDVAEVFSRQIEEADGQQHDQDNAGLAPPEWRCAR